MSEYYVVCSCGYRRRVTQASMGLSGRCPRCGREIIVNDSNLVEAGESSGFEEEEAGREDLAIEFRSGGSAPAGQGCARCGRPFRGDWDRYRTSEGVLCNICANRAAEQADTTSAPEPVPVMTPAQRAQIAAVAAEVASRDLTPAPEAEPEEESFAERNHERIRTAVIVAGVLVVAFTVVVVLFDPLSSARHGAGGDTDAAAVQEAAEDLPPYMGLVALAIQILVGYVAEFCALYFVLQWANALPNDSLELNIVAVGVGAFCAHVAWLAPVHMLPLLGMIFGPIRAVAVLYVIHEVYGLSFWECITYLIGHVLLGFAARAASVLIFGVLVNLLL
ncbi:MAG: hypothetical protein JXR94_04755 [Candidatus Hydrogenedentes bacterium]|nr:hypothetical protein [Candidatus Hydrogenedentota bacterium]